ncbi:MAG: JDVT-CTERM domain-containing protein [Gammaproteobacteria bacterium]|nr:JDVT-CTERM domain-containing protein [Gammaproteobacteria bacterium]
MLQIKKYMALIAIAIFVFSITSGVCVAANPVAIGSQTSVSNISNGDGINPAIAYNFANNEYLVVWSGDETTGQKFQIFGQRIDATTGTVIVPDSFLIGSMAGDDSFDALNPAVSYNPDENEYLVVWEGNDIGVEIFGRLVSATGEPKGTTATRISFMGGASGNVSREAHNPDVCYNTATQQYLVVWAGDGLPLVNNENEVFGNFVEPSLDRSADIRISEMGPEGEALRDAASPAVACNNTDSGEYYVVWWGDDIEHQDMEIYAQRLDVDGSKLPTDFKISLTGGNAPATDDGFRAQFPDVVYNTDDNRYLVVWQGGDTTAPATNKGFEVYGQLIDATNGTEIDPNDFQISFMGGSAGDVTREARFPALAFNSVNNEYIAAWEGDDDSGANDDFQIYSNVITADGMVNPSDEDVKISNASLSVDHTTPELNAGPAIAFGVTDGRYLVAWEEEITAADFEIVAHAVSGPEATFRLTESALSVAENAGSATVTVQRIGNTNNAVTVQLTTAPDTTEITDFTDASTLLDFDSDETLKTVDIRINDDSIDESDETVIITLSDALPSGEATIAPSGARAVLTITDNDSGGDGVVSAGGSDGGGGGGGCTLGTSKFDPVLPLLILAASGYLLRRKKLFH